jgi:5'-AMP-activated protein kinase catalytic alpha subunit
MYLSDNEEEIKTWIFKIQKAIGYTDLTEIYEIKQKLGNGKFGIVKLGIHKETGQKVAIKIMAKKDMTDMDRELTKTEIDVLKICQHPNIIRIYDIFENVDFIFISMKP